MSTVQNGVLMGAQGEWCGEGEKDSDPLLEYSCTILAWISLWRELSERYKDAPRKAKVVDRSYERWEKMSVPV